MTESILLELTGRATHLFEDRLGEGKDTRSSGSVFDLVAAYGVLADLLERQLNGLQKQLREGCEGQCLREILAPIMEATQHARQVGVRLTPVTPAEYVEEVEDSTAKVERVHVALEKLSTWINAPRPVFDPDQRQSAPADSREGYVSLSDIRARLRSTGRP